MEKALPQLTLFKYNDEDHFENIRTVEIDGKIWFAAIDVCTLLEIANVPREVSSLDEDEKLLYEMRIAGQNRKINFVSESGLYALIFKSKKATAKKFRKWVTEEVIPSIRQKGSYGVERTRPQSLLPTYSSRILSEPTRGVPKGYWSIFDRSHKIMLLVEKYVGSVNQYDLVDGSIGIHWSKYRQGKSWQGLSASYPHQYEDKRGTVMCKCYSKTEGDHFDDWLEEIYMPNHLPSYLQTKYSGNPTMLRNVEKLLPRLLKAS